MSRGHPNDFTLKVCGQEEYLLGDYPLIQFNYIQDCLARDITPTLVTLSRDSVSVDHDNIMENAEADALQRTRPSSSTLTLRKKGKHISAWKIEEPFVFTVNAISRLNCDAAHRTVEVSSNICTLEAAIFCPANFVFVLGDSRLYRSVSRLAFFTAASPCAKVRRRRRPSLVPMVVANGKKR